MSTKFLEVLSINYDFIPSQLESPKMLWVTLKYPPPNDFKVDSLVRLHLRPGVGINTVNGRPGLESTFYVNDIVGLRVMLVPSTVTWAPNKTQDGCSNFGWGYDMRQMNVRPSRQNWEYGYGHTTSFLEYHPVIYRNFPTLL